MNKRKAYDTDLTDEQWKLIEPLMWKSGNKIKCEKRELINAVLYLGDSGCKWRQLPHDFPPYTTVLNFYRKAVREGLWDKILKMLVQKTRKTNEKNDNPTYAMNSTKFFSAREIIRIFFLEFGVGYSTPVIIKYPLWKMTAENPNATYDCINYGEYFCH